MTMRIKGVWDGIEAIVLDAVGTLIEPWPTVAEVYAAAALRQGIELDRNVVRTRFGQAFREDALGETFEALVTDEWTEFRRWRNIVASVLPEIPEPERAFEELWDHFGRPESWRSFPDVGPSLTSLAACGMPIAIASNFDGRLRAVVVGLPELTACRPALIISSEVGFRKPHPSFYQAVSDHLGHPPEALLMVGDDPENDVLGAGRAGLRGVWLDRRARPDGSSGSDLIRVEDLTALVAFSGRFRGEAAGHVEENEGGEPMN